MAQQTAINWLREKLQETYDKERKLPLAYTFSLLNKAEQIEKEQIIDAHMYSSGNSSIVEAEYLAEQYYNATYGK